MKQKDEEVNNRIVGVVIVMRIPKDESSGPRREAFLKFDSYKNLSGEVKPELLNKKVYAVVRIAKEGGSLVEVVLVKDEEKSGPPSHDVNDKELRTIIGKLTKVEKGYTLIGGVVRLESNSIYLRKLRDRRISAKGRFAQFHTEDGYFEGFKVEDYTLYKQSTLLDFTKSLSNQADSDSEVSLVARVESCHVTISKSYPPELLIIARGG